MSEIEGGAPVEGTPAGTTPEATSAPQDAFAPVLSRMDELAGSIDTRFAQFEQRLPAAPEPQQPEDPWAALMGGAEPEAPQYFDQFGNPVELPAQQPGLDLGQLQQAIAAQQQQAIAPLQQTLQQMQAERDMQTLGTKVPALAMIPEGQPGHEENKANRAKAFDLVSAALQNFPAAEANRLGADPNFISIVWKAAEADRNAQGQAPVGGPPSLETAGGALPGGQSAPIDPVTSAYGTQPQGLSRAFR